MLALKDFFCSTLVWSGGSNLPIKSAQKHNPTVGIAVTAVINLPTSGGRKEFVYDQPSLHSYLIL